MGYSSFKNLNQVKAKFDIMVRRANLFKEITPIEPTDWLKRSIEIAYDNPLSNEKGKSERLISPILSEVHQLFKDKLTLFSGEELNIEPENDLNGPCDFFFSAVSRAYLLEAPIVTLAEAKNEDMDYGIAQCTAQMIGAMKFNHREEKPTKEVWGCSTTAGEWTFLKLTEPKANSYALTINTTSYYVSNVPALLGAFNVVLGRIVQHTLN